MTEVQERRKKTVEASMTEQVHLIMQQHLNGGGRLFGGALMQPDGMRHTVNRAFFVMVAVDEDQKPIQVPELIITTEAEKARNEAAKMRRDMRRQRRENGF